MTREHREGHKKRRSGILSRLSWMFKVRDCRHICLFCEHYGKCKEDGISGKGEES